MCLDILVKGKKGTGWLHPVNLGDPSAEGDACGKCDSCILRIKGFKEAGVEDPTRYIPNGWGSRCNRKGKKPETICSRQIDCFLCGILIPDDLPPCPYWKMWPGIADLIIGVGQFLAHPFAEKGFLYYTQIYSTCKILRMLNHSKSITAFDLDSIWNYPYQQNIVVHLTVVAAVEDKKPRC